MTLDRLYRDVENLKKQYRGLAGGPQLALSSIENGNIDVNDEDGNLVSTIGLQEDGSGATRFFDGPTPPVPAGFTALADGPLIQGTWDGSFVDGQQATYDLAYLEVAATLVDDDSRVSFATITAKEGASAALVANQSGQWAVAVRSVSQAGKKSEFASAGTVEVKLVDLAGAIEAVQDSANGKNKVTYSDRPPTPADPGIFDDTWFVGQVGRPNDVVEATNIVANSSLETDAAGWSPYSWTGSGSRTQGAGAFGDWFYRLTATSAITGLKGRYHDVLTTVKSGQKWTLSIHVRPSRTISLRPQGEFRGPSGVVGSPQYGNYFACPAGEWTRIHMTITAVGDATTIRHQTYLHDATLQAGDTLDLDAEMIALGPLMPYFDGDTPSGETDNESHYRWTGEPHASTSEKYLPALDIGDSDNWNVIEQYRHDGTGWVKVELSHYVFSTVDLGKATVGELDGIRIMARTITGDLFSGDAFDGIVFRGNTFVTRDGNGEFSDRGLFFQKPDGTAIFRVPTDGTPISMSAADVQIQRAQVDELELVDGEVRSGGVMTLASGVTAPASPAELNASWKRETQLPRPEESSMDWTGLAYWNGMYVRGVNVLGSAGDSADRIEVYNPDGTLNKSIPIDLNPRAGVAVIGDIVYTVGPDHVASNAGKQWCHGFNLNTGARVSRWEMTRFGSTFAHKLAIGASGSNIIVAGINTNGRLYVVSFNASTGTVSDVDAAIDFDTGSPADLYGVALSSNYVYVSPRQTVRRYTVSGSSLSAEGNAWDNPNLNSGGFTLVDDRPVVVDSGAVYTGSKFAQAATVSACFTWTNETHETTPSPVANVQVATRESVTVSLPVRAGLQKHLYLKSSQYGGNWTKTTVPENTTSVLIDEILAGLDGPPAQNTFPASTPAILKSGVGNLEFRGDGSGRIGPLTFNADGSMTGIPKLAHGTVVVGNIAGGANQTIAVTFPSGMFSAPPAVTWTSRSPRLSPAADTITATSFSARLYNFTTAGTLDSTFDWIAVGE